MIPGSSIHDVEGAAGQLLVLQTSLRGPAAWAGAEAGSPGG